MHCLDCGNKLELNNYNESCTKWECQNCNAFWYQTRSIIIQWEKKVKPLNNLNGGINSSNCNTEKPL